MTNLVVLPPLTFAALLLLFLLMVFEVEVILEVILEVMTGFWVSWSELTPLELLSFSSWWCEFDFGGWVDSISCVYDLEGLSCDLAFKMSFSLMLRAAFSALKLCDFCKFVLVELVVVSVVVLVADGAVTLCDLTSDEAVVGGGGAGAEGVVDGTSILIRSSGVTLTTVFSAGPDCGEEWVIDIAGGAEANFTSGNFSMG